MLPYILGGAVVLGVLAWLSDSENKARQEFENSQARLKSRLNNIGQDINNVRQESNYNVRFQKYIALYYASIEQSKSQYKDYETYKELIATIKNKKNEIYQKISGLKVLKENATYAMKQQYRQKISQYYEWLDEIKAELARLYDKKADLLAMVRKTNNNTHQIK